MANGFKQVQVTVDEWERYNRLAKQMTEELGVKVYINGVIKRAVNLYEKTNKPSSDTV